MLRSLAEEMKDAGFPKMDKTALKKRIKSIHDTYRIELTKVKNSTRTGRGTDEIYHSKLSWFNQADALLNEHTVTRPPTSNLVRSKYKVQTTSNVLFII